MGSADAAEEGGSASGAAGEHEAVYQEQQGSRSEDAGGGEEEEEDEKEKNGKIKVYYGCGCWACCFCCFCCLLEFLFFFFTNEIRMPLESLRCGLGRLCSMQMAVQAELIESMSTKATVLLPGMKRIPQTRPARLKSARSSVSL